MEKFHTAFATMSQRIPVFPRKFWNISKWRNSVLCLYILSLDQLSMLTQLTERWGVYVEYNKQNKKSTVLKARKWLTEHNPKLLGYNQLEKTCSYKSSWLTVWILFYQSWQGGQYRNKMMSARGERDLFFCCLGKQEFLSEGCHRALQ